MHIMSLHNILAELKRALKSPQKPGKPRGVVSYGNLNNSAIFSTFPFKIQIVHLVEFNASNTLVFPKESPNCCLWALMTGYM